MTKEEMLKEVNGDNYTRVQSLIMEAMKDGKTSETFCMIDKEPLRGWEITDETIKRLKDDGFDVHEITNKFGLYEGTVEVSW